MPHYINTLLRATIFIAALFAAHFAVAAEQIGPDSSQGEANFTCNAEIGLCECEGDKSSIDCKAMRRNCKDVDDLFSTESPHDAGKLFCEMSKQGPSGTRPGSGGLRRDAQGQGPAIESEQRVPSTRAPGTASDPRKQSDRINTIVEVGGKTGNTPSGAGIISPNNRAVAPDHSIVSPNNRIIPPTEKPSRDPQAGAGAAVRDKPVERTVRDHRIRRKSEGEPITSLDCLVGSEKLRRSGYVDIVVNECEGPEYTYTARSGTGIVRAHMHAHSGKMRITYLGIANPR